MVKTLVVVDCTDWAIYSLIKPLKELGIDICYHYTSTTKGTGIGEKNPIHLRIELLEKYDQIHFTTIRATDLMLMNPTIVKALKGKRLIMTVHTEREDDLELLKGKHWQLIDTFISPTLYQMSKVQEYTGANQVYIPFAIDEDKYKFISNYSNENKIIGYVGRITSHKRLREIVGASEGYNVVAIGYVDDNRSGYWQEIPKKNLTMYQGLTEEQKIEQMKKFSVLVSVSQPHIETGPLGVLECAALGIPIITTDTGWAHDMLSKDSAFIVDQSLADLKLQINVAMNNPELVQAKRLKARTVIDYWRLEDYINAHKEVYD